MEFIIENISIKEMDILEDNNINWYPDFFSDMDACFEEKTEYEKALKLLERI